MGRGKTFAKNYNKTKADLLLSLRLKNLNEKYYLDLVEDYMNFFTDSFDLQKSLDKVSNQNEEGEKDIELVKEKRQINKQMMNILSFLSLKPPEELVVKEHDDL